MWTKKYLYLAIIPLFAIGFLSVTLLHKEPVSFKQQIAKADQIGPVRITTVTAPAIAEATPQTDSPPTQPVVQPTISAAPKIVVKPNTAVKSSSTTVTPAPKLSTSCSGSLATQFICLLNSYRSSKGLRPLSYSSSLSAVALAHSQWMQTTGIFSHQETDGSHMTQRCAAAGTVCHAENLAEGITSPQQLLNMWIASADHNVNLLGSYSVIGIGISGAYITADFN